MARNAEQPSHARLLNVLRPQQRVKVPVPGVPASVIITLQAGRLDFGVKPDLRIIDSLVTATQKPQQELVVFDRAYAVLETLQIDLKRAHGIEHRPTDR